MNLKSVKDASSVASKLKPGQKVTRNVRGVPVQISRGPGGGFIVQSGEFSQEVSKENLRKVISGISYDNRLVTNPPRTCKIDLPKSKN